MDIVVGYDVVIMFLYFFLVGFVFFDYGVYFVDVFWIGNCNFDIRILDVFLEVIDVFVYG